MSYKKIIIIVIVLGVIALIVAGFTMWNRSRAEQSLDVTVNGPQRVLVGVPFELKVTSSNKSRSILKDARLELRLPEEMVFAGFDPSEKISRRDLGDLGSGSLTNESFEVIMLGGKDTLKKVIAQLSYSPSTIGSRFEKSTEFDISVGGRALTMDIVAPKKVLSSESFEIEVSYKNTSDTELDNLQLRLQYPPAFTFERATLEPDEGDNIWNLGSLRPGSEMNFTIIGNLFGPDGSFFDFESAIQSGFAGAFYGITQNTATISISPSPLSLNITLNEASDFVANPGDILRYTVSYANNTDVGLQDAVITLQLIGAMYDFTRLSKGPTYRSIDNTLIWTEADHAPLGIIPPGGSGEVNFFIGAKRNYPIRRLGDRDFVLKISGQIVSPTVPFFLATEKTFGLGSVETKVNGSVKLEAKALFRDAASGVVNVGPFPPRVNQPTQFTTHWILTNFATNISNVRVSAFLDGDVRFVKNVSTNWESEPRYNPLTQEIIWLLPRVPATKGVIDEPIHAIFQIEGTPSSNMVGGPMPLIQVVNVTAVDDFTGETLTTFADPLDTKLKGDPSVVFGEGFVNP